MKTKFPITVRRGNIAVKIYRQPAANVFTVVYYEDGMRRRPSFANLDTACKHANSIVERLALGEGNQIVLRDTEHQKSS